MKEYTEPKVEIIVLCTEDIMEPSNMGDVDWD